MQRVPIPSRTASGHRQAQEVKASSRWIHWTSPSVVAGGAALPPQSGNPRQNSPASRLAVRARAHGDESNARGQMDQRRAGERRARFNVGRAETVPARRAAHDHHRQQHHRIEQVHDDDRGWQVELHDHRSQQHLDDQQDRRREAGPNSSRCFRCLRQATATRAKTATVTRAATQR